MVPMIGPTLTAFASAQRQFNLERHYDLMAQLDADVHDDDALSRAEAETALRLIRAVTNSVPSHVSLPCFGTGRHIPCLLEGGVKRITGVDLSEACVEKARHALSSKAPAVLVQGDVREHIPANVDAVILLGNSFGDLIDLRGLRQMTEAMVAPLPPGGAFLMDYIGKGFLERCRNKTVGRWDAMFDGRKVLDERIPCYDGHGVMTINVVVRDAETRKQVATTCYQKRILDDREVVTFFDQLGVTLTRIGPAHEVNLHYAGQPIVGLGMIGASTWWVGVKR